MKLSVFAILSVISAAVAETIVPITLPVKPVGENPEGNSLIKPELNELVEAGKPYTITWTPTTPENTVLLALLRGPGNNIVPIKLIGTNLPNNGKFVWTPGTDLEDDVTHYGIQLVDEKTGKYQYTPQFGIKNDAKPKPTDTKTTGTTTTTEATETETETDTTETDEPTTTETTKTGKPTTVTTTTTTEEEEETTTTAPTTVITSTRKSNVTTTGTPTESETDPAPEPTESVPSSAGRTVASFGMAGFLVAVVGLVL